MATIRAMVADNLDMVRKGMRVLLSDEDDIVAVDEATTGLQR